MQRWSQRNDQAYPPGWLANVRPRFASAPARSGAARLFGCLLTPINWDIREAMCSAIEIATLRAADRASQAQQSGGPVERSAQRNQDAEEAQHGRIRRFSWNACCCNGASDTKVFGKPADEVLGAQVALAQRTDFSDRPCHGLGNQTPGMTQPLPPGQVAYRGRLWASLLRASRLNAPKGGSLSPNLTQARADRYCLIGQRHLGLRHKLEAQASESATSNPARSRIVLVFMVAHENVALSA